MGSKSEDSINSKIVLLAQHLHLHPKYSKEDQSSWTAFCPGRRDCFHTLSLSARTETFSCKHCGKGGGTKELQRFFEHTVKANLAPVIAILENQIGSPANYKKIYISVSWYYGLITPKLTLKKAEWKTIMQGLPFSKNGNGYWSEEGFSHDYWLFNYGVPGSLEVEYDDGGQGFVGHLEDAQIEVG
jgi:hypothetical protein